MNMSKKMSSQKTIDQEESSVKKICFVLVVSIILGLLLSVNATAVSYGYCRDCGQLTAELYHSSYIGESDNFNCSYYTQCVYYLVYYRTLESCTNCGLIINDRKVHSDYRIHSRVNCPKYASNGTLICPFNY